MNIIYEPETSTKESANLGKQKNKDSYSTELPDTERRAAIYTPLNAIQGNSQWQREHSDGMR